MEESKQVPTKVAEEKPVVAEEKAEVAEKKAVVAEDKPVVKEEEAKEKETETEKMSVDEAKPEVPTVPKVENIKKEEDVTPELLEKIKKQVEFYFGDVNMQRDKFMNEQVQLDEGWIPMTVMLNFKMLISLSGYVDTILKAIETSDLMEISEDRKKIRRKPTRPLPTYDEEYKKAQAARTVYVKGFPLTGIWIQKLKEFFKDFEPFENIVMRKYLDPTKKLNFKGSVFVQFETVEGAKAFVARESVKYEGTELIRKFSEDYAVEKAKEKEERKKGSEKKNIKSEKIPKQENGDAEEEKEPEQPALPKGSVLFFSGASESSDWEGIKKSLFELDAEVAYVDYKLGNTEGYIRLQGENSAKPILEKMTDNKIKIDGKDVTFEILEDEVEEEYLKKAKTSMAQQASRKQQKSKRGRPKRGRGGAQRGRKRHGSPVGNSPKKVAT